LLSRLSVDEANDVRSIVGEVCEVEEIRGDYVVVSKEFDRGNDRIESHSISVHVDDLEDADPCG
jgi:hypothetical protein